MRFKLVDFKLLVRDVTIDPQPQVLYFVIMDFMTALGWPGFFFKVAHMGLRFKRFVTKTMF